MGKIGLRVIYTIEQAHASTLTVEDLENRTRSLGFYCINKTTFVPRPTKRATIQNVL